jgi:hypothetical protein
VLRIREKKANKNLETWWSLTFHITEIHHHGVTN